jgi:PKD repeat protein
MRGPDVPVADFTFDPDDASVQELVSFDASDTTLAGNPCLANCTYSWNFGDGSSASGLGVSHTFSTAGVFNVTLTATTLSGTSASVTKPVRIAVPPAPTAVLTINPLSPAAGQSIVFSSASVLPLGVSISAARLDDRQRGGRYRHHVVVHHRGGFAAATSHQVTLTITDNYGRTSRSTRATIRYHSVRGG